MYLWAAQPGGFISELVRSINWSDFRSIYWSDFQWTLCWLRQANFEEGFINESDPSVLRFLIASRQEVTSTQLRDDLLSMLVAGHETTASVLTWTLHLLGQHPEKLAKASTPCFPALQTPAFWDVIHVCMRPCPKSIRMTTACFDIGVYVGWSVVGCVVGPRGGRPGSGR